MSVNLSTEDWKKLESDLEKVLTPLFAGLFKDTSSESKENDTRKMFAGLFKDTSSESKENDTCKKKLRDLEEDLLYKQREMLEELEEIEDVIKTTDHLYFEDDFVDVYRRAYELSMKINFIDEFLTEQEDD